MTLRDWFAGQALIGLIVASSSTDRGVNGKPMENPSTHFWAMREFGPGATPIGYKNATFAQIYAWEAYDIADAMMSEREVGNE